MKYRYNSPGKSNDSAKSKFTTLTSVYYRKKKIQADFKYYILVVCFANELTVIDVQLKQSKKYSEK
jgi:hypothetical protein